jgi:pimeloyl-ACP methyl ester carboxylesterase
MAFNPTYGTVENEDCELHYWYQGTGPLLVMVPGGGGNGDQYNKIMTLLDKPFTVATFDRRQMSASKAKENKLFNPAQSARDIIAITKAIGRPKASIFANSGGGIIALQLAASYPAHLEHHILHEIPTTSLLNDATFQLDRCFEILQTYKTSGIPAAMGLFAEQLVGMGSPGDFKPDVANLHNWFQNEFLVMTLYCPDLAKVVENRVSVAVMAGELSGMLFMLGRRLSRLSGCSVPGLWLQGITLGLRLRLRRLRLCWLRLWICWRRRMALHTRDEPCSFPHQNPSA